MFDKKLGRDNSLVIVHSYFQHLSPMSTAYVCLPFGQSKATTITGIAVIEVCFFNPSKKEYIFVILDKSSLFAYSSPGYPQM